MDIYRILNDIIKTNKYRISTSLFTNTQRDILCSEEEKSLFDLIKNISSLNLKISDSGAEFTPMAIFEGRRTFSIDDLTESDYDALSSLDFQKLPLNLKARISDILWLQKKQYPSSKIAIEAYWELFNNLYSPSDWFESLRMIKRAIYISGQIKDETTKNKYLEDIFDKIITINGEDTDFLSLSLIEIICTYRYGDLNKIINVLDKIISVNQDNPNKVERAHELKFKCINKLHTLEDAKHTCVDLADYFRKYAERCVEMGDMGILKSHHFYIKAIMLYRNNGEPQKAEETHRDFIIIQRKLPELMHNFLTYQLDVDRIKQNIAKNMQGLTFEEAILKLILIIKFYKKEEIKKQVIEDITKYPASHLFSSNALNKKGQTVFTLPGLNVANPEEDEELLNLHIHRKMYELESVSGDLYLRFVFQYIKDNYPIEKESFDFITDDSIIIPPERRKIIASGLRMAFQGDYYEALHILAPQMENVFRYIAAEVGGVTVTLDAKGASAEKTLTSIFDLPELVDCYDNDILFVFQGLLNEHAGANIRNNIAHGLMDEGHACSGASIFFVCAVLKLFVISSRYCIDILTNKKELFDFTNPDTNVVKLPNVDS